MNMHYNSVKETVINYMAENIITLADTITQIGRTTDYTDSDKTFYRYFDLDLPVTNLKPVYENPELGNTFLLENYAVFRKFLLIWKYDPSNYDLSNFVANVADTGHFFGGCFNDSILAAFSYRENESADVAEEDDPNGTQNNNPREKIDDVFLMFDYRFNHLTNANINDVDMTDEKSQSMNELMFLVNELIKNTDNEGFVNVKEYLKTVFDKYPDLRRNVDVDLTDLNEQIEYIRNVYEVNYHLSQQNIDWNGMSNLILSRLDDIDELIVFGSNAINAELTLPETNLAFTFTNTVIGTHTNITTNTPNSILTTVTIITNRTPTNLTLQHTNSVTFYGYVKKLLYPVIENLNSSDFIQLYEFEMRMQIIASVLNPDMETDINRYITHLSNLKPSIGDEEYERLVYLSRPLWKENDLVLLGIDPVTESVIKFYNGKYDNSVYLDRLIQIAKNPSDTLVPIGDELRNDLSFMLGYLQEKYGLTDSSGSNYEKLISYIKIADSYFGTNMDISGWCVNPYAEWYADLISKTDYFSLNSIKQLITYEEFVMLLLLPDITYEHYSMITVPLTNSLALDLKNENKYLSYHTVKLYTSPKSDFTTLIAFTTNYVHSLIQDKNLSLQDSFLAVDRIMNDNNFSNFVNKWHSKVIDSGNSDVRKTLKADITKTLSDYIYSDQRNIIDSYIVYRLASQTFDRFHPYLWEIKMMLGLPFNDPLIEDTVTNLNRSLPWARLLLQCGSANKVLMINKNRAVDNYFYDEILSVTTNQDYIDYRNQLTLTNDVKHYTDKKQMNTSNLDFLDNIYLYNSGKVEVGTYIYTNDTIISRIRDHSGGYYYMIETSESLPENSTITLQIDNRNTDALSPSDYSGESDKVVLIDERNTHAVWGIGSLYLLEKQITDTYEMKVGLILSSNRFDLCAIRPIPFDDNHIPEFNRLVYIDPSQIDNAMTHPGKIIIDGEENRFIPYNTFINKDNTYYVLLNEVPRTNADLVLILGESKNKNVHLSPITNLRILFDGFFEIVITDPPDQNNGIVYDCFAVALSNRIDTLNLIPAESFYCQNRSIELHPDKTLTNSTYTTNIDPVTVSDTSSNVIIIRSNIEIIKSDLIRFPEVFSIRSGQKSFAVIDLAVLNAEGDE